MRRPHSKLQVSMFPFLAVLLCVMGALLLLLFLMDRRAKIAAQHQVSEMKAERSARTKTEEDARRAEWEKAKQALHQSLLVQQDQVQADSKTLDANLKDADKSIDVVQTKHLDLNQKIQTEADKIALLQAQIAAQRSGVKEHTQKETASKAELLEAAKALAELELAFQTLRTLRENDKKTYSVVPYRGKHGDQRPPIYVECVRDGVLFHPEKRLLNGLDFTATSLRNEVERRTGPLQLDKTAHEKLPQPIEKRMGPYVLFLVRPDGIANYYQAQSALKGYQLDFGYELVDQHWALDFEGAPGAKAAPPSQVAKSNDPPKVSTPGLPLFPGTSHERNASGGIPGNGPSNPPLTILQPPGTDKGNGGAGSFSIQPAPGPGDSGPPPFTVQPPGTAKSGPATGTPALIGNSPHNGVDTGIPVRSPSFVPISKFAPPIPIATTGSGTPRNPGAATNGTGPGDTVKPPAGDEPGVSPINGPIPGNSAGSPQRPAHPQDGNAGDPSSDANLRPLPVFAAEPKKKTPTAPPLGRVLGNKDFLITIDCHGDHVSVFPGGMTFRWTPVNMKATDQALVNAITNLIAKRQASVRAGEPAYRPVIRFQVSAEGLRSYYHAYPLLESLGVPMRRENISE